jgi:hypothetical protein
VKRRHKFNAVPTVVDGVRFASKAEAKRYAELKLLERAGQIDRLVLQAEFPLYAKDTKLGKYIADFYYFDRRTSQHVIEDVKGFKTPLYRWKKKHVEAEYGFPVIEIGRTKSKRAA